MVILECTLTLYSEFRMKRESPQAIIRDKEQTQLLQLEKLALLVSLVMQNVTKTIKKQVEHEWRKIILPVANNSLSNKEH